MGAHCRTKADGAPGPAGPRGLCLPCEAACLDALRQLPSDYRRLKERLEPSGAGLGSAIPSGSVEAPLPLNVAADYRMRNIHWVLCEWVTPVRVSSRLYPIDARSLLMDEAVSWATIVLVNHFSALIALGETLHRDYATGDYATGDGVDAAIQFSSVHARSIAFLGDNEIWEDRQLPCPPGSKGCGKYTLGTYVGSGVIRCSSCQWSCSINDYTNYTLTLVPPERT